MSSNFVVNTTLDNIMDALAAVIAPFLPAGTQIIRAFQNRVPPPQDPYVLLTELFEIDLETPTVTTTDQVSSFLTPTRFDVQIDIYGATSGDWAKAIKTVWRTPYFCLAFAGALENLSIPGQIQPLFCEDGRQAAVTLGEQQYENRWILTARLQYNPLVTVPQQSANELKVNEVTDLP